MVVVGVMMTRRDPPTHTHEDEDERPQRGLAWGFGNGEGKEDEWQYRDVVRWRSGVWDRLEMERGDGLGWVVVMMGRRRSSGSSSS